MKYKNTAIFLYLFTLLNTGVLGNNKEYHIYAYDALKVFTLTIHEEKLTVEPVGLGSFLLKESLVYKNQSLSDKNLVINLLTNEKMDIVDSKWVSDVPILDNTVVDVRFLFAEEDEVVQNGKGDSQKTITALLYRMDIVSNSGERKKNNQLNNALIDSTLRKVWVEKDTGAIIKLSFKYNKITYIINTNEN